MPSVDWVQAVATARKAGFLCLMQSAITSIKVEAMEFESLDVSSRHGGIDFLFVVRTP